MCAHERHMAPTRFVACCLLRGHFIGTVRLPQDFSMNTNELLSDLMSMLHEDTEAREDFREYLMQHQITSPPEISQLAKNPDVSATNLYRMDRLFVNVHHAIGGSTRPGFCIFFSDCVVACDWLHNTRETGETHETSLTVVKYGVADKNIPRLPYTSKELLSYWDRVRREPCQALRLHLINAINIWLILEHFQQVRWYALVDELATNVEVESERRLALNMLPAQGTLAKRFEVVLDTVCRLSVPKAGKLLSFMAGILAFAKPGNNEVGNEFNLLKKLRKLGMDRASLKEMKRIISEMFKAMRAAERDAAQLAQPRFDATMRWQRAIHMQIQANRQDREDRMLTAKNRVEARKREIVRERCDAEKSKVCVPPLTTPGPSGPVKTVAWRSEALGPSERAKRRAKKEADAEARRALRAETQSGGAQRAAPTGEDAHAPDRRGYDEGRMKEE